MNYRKHLLKRYCTEYSLPIIAFLVVMLIFSITALIWQYDLRAVLYAAVFCFIAAAIVFVAGFIPYRRKITHLTSLIGDFDSISERLPEKVRGSENEWLQIVLSLNSELQKRTHDREVKLAEAENYYTAWAHQIKVPISALHLIVQTMPENDRRDVNAELMRIEQYCDMIMAYIRLDKCGSDYVFREVELDKAVSRVLKKYSTMFIRKKLRLEYVPGEVCALSDEKWLIFILEQLISNAIKYTSSGTISVVITENRQIVISDTGIGISPEDLPRIFEKGFTGINGRIDSRASGIGLYLTKRICSNLGYNIFVESKLGEGSTFTVDLNKEKIEAND